MASCAACPDACGRPPIARTTSSLLISPASLNEFPFAISVISEPHAIAGDTSLGAKTNVADNATLQLHEQLKDVAARRVLHPRPPVRVRQFACIPRMFEVIEQLGRIHDENYCSKQPSSCLLKGHHKYRDIP